MNTTSRSYWETSLDWLQRLVTSDNFLFILKRILQALLTVLLASALSFFIIKLSPGDYIDTLRQIRKFLQKELKN